MSGPSEAGTPQPESGVLGDQSAPASAEPLPAAPSDNAPAALPEVSEPKTDIVATEGTDAVPAPTAEGTDAGPPPPLPAPVPVSKEAASQARDLLLAQGSRILALGTLLGGAFGLWTQLAFRSPWLDAFLL